jgi:hypothetical protein
MGYTSLCQAHRCAQRPSIEKFRLFQYLGVGIVPRSMLLAKGMHSTTHLYNGVGNALLQEAYLVFHHLIAFHTANGMFNMTDTTGLIDHWDFVSHTSE